MSSAPTGRAASPGWGNSPRSPRDPSSASRSRTGERTAPRSTHRPWTGVPPGGTRRLRGPLPGAPGLPPRSSHSSCENLKPVFMIMPLFPWTPVNCTTKINGEPSRLVLKDGPSCGLRSVTRHPLAASAGSSSCWYHWDQRTPLRDGISTAHQRIISPLLKAS